MRQAILTSIIILFVFGIVATYVCLFPEYYKIQTLEDNHGGKMIIYEETSWEGTIPFYYEVWYAGQLVIEKTIFKLTAFGGTFTTVSSCHPRKSGDPRPKDWIPASAGMTDSSCCLFCLKLQIPILLN